MQHILRSKEMICPQSNDGSELTLRSPGIIVGFSSLTFFMPHNIHGKAGIVLPVMWIRKVRLKIRNKEHTIFKWHS